MKSITIIGTVLFDEVLTSNNSYLPTGCNKMNLTTSFGGSMHNVAWNCSTLKVPCHFFSKFGNDALAYQVRENLMNRGAMVYGPTIDLPTPRFYTISHSNKQQLFSTITPDFFFNKHDTVDETILHHSAYIVSDSTNSEFIANLIEFNPEGKYILSGNIPHPVLLPYIQGLVLNEQEFNNYAQTQNADDYASKIIKAGVNWLIITLGERGCIYYCANKKRSFDTEPSNSQYTLGCGDAFLSGILYGLALNLPIESTIPLGLKAASEALQSPSALSETISKITAM